MWHYIQREDRARHGHRDREGFRLCQLRLWGQRRDRAHVEWVRVGRKEDQSYEVRVQNVCLIEWIEFIKIAISDVWGRQNPLWGCRIQIKVGRKPKRRDPLMKRKGWHTKRCGTWTQPLSRDNHLTIRSRGIPRRQSWTRVAKVKGWTENCNKVLLKNG